MKSPCSDEQFGDIFLDFFRVDPNRWYVAVSPVYHLTGY
jgi:hypothetical protein